MPVQNISSSINNTYKLSNSTVKQNTFESFVHQNSLYPQIPLYVSKAYATPQLYPEYKVLETFKLPNTGEGKVYQLRNGHKVIVLPKKGPTVINTFVGAGWNNETPYKREVAHLLEHLLSEIEYKNNANELINIDKNLNITSNANTSGIKKNYYTLAPVFNNEELEKLIKFQFDILFKPDFNDKDIEKEKKIIVEEHLKSNLKKTEINIVDELTLMNLLNYDNSENYSLIHNTDAYSVKNVSRQDLLDYYNKYYTPDNMYTVIIGNVDEKSIKLFSKYFNKPQNNILNYRKTEIDKLFSNTIKKAIRNDMEKHEGDLSLASSNLGFLVDNQTSPKGKALENLIIRILQNRLDNIPNHFSYVDIADIFFTGPKNIIKITTVDEDKNINARIEDIYNEFNKIYNFGFTEQELTEAKEKYKEYNIFNNTESTLELSNILSENLAYSNDAAKNQFAKYVDSATTADINDAFKKNFDISKASLTVLHPPKNKSNVAFKGNLKLSDCINPSEINLSNNIKVLFDESDGILKTSIDYYLVSPLKGEINKELISYLANRFEYGNANKSTLDNNTEFSSQMSGNELSLKFNGNNSRTLNMVNAGIQEIFYPDFGTVNDFEKYKQNQISEITNNPKKNNAIDEFFKDSPWLNSKTNIQNLTLQDVQSFYNKFLSNAQLSVHITIPKSVSNLYKNTIVQTLSNLPTFKKNNFSDYFNIVPITQVNNNKIFIEKDNRDVVEISKYYKINRTGNIKDIAGLNILNIILGKDEDGYLFQKLRTEKQITYGAYSDITNNTALKNLSMFELYTITSAKNIDNLKTSLNVFQELTDKLQNELIDTEALERTKRKFKTLIFNDCDVSSKRNGYLKFCVDSFYGANYFKELDKAIDEITPQYLRELAKYYFSQPALYQISGNKDAIEASKEYLKTLGEIVE